MAELVSPIQSNNDIPESGQSEELKQAQQENSGAHNDHTHNKMEDEADGSEEEFLDAHEDIADKNSARDTSTPDRPQIVQYDTTTSDPDDSVRHIDSGTEGHTATSTSEGHEDNTGSTHELTGDENVPVHDDRTHSCNGSTLSTDTTSTPHVDTYGDETNEHRDESGHETDTNNMESLVSVSTNETSNDGSIPRDTVSISTSLQVSINSTQPLEDLTPTSSPPRQCLVDTTSFESPGLLYARIENENATSTPNRRSSTPPPESGGDVLLLENVIEEGVVIVDAGDESSLTEGDGVVEDEEPQLSTTLPIDPYFVTELEQRAQALAKELNTMIDGLHNNLSAMCECTHESILLHSECSQQLKEVVDDSTKAMYGFLTHFNELYESLKPVPVLAAQMYP